MGEKRETELRSGLEPALIAVTALILTLFSLTAWPAMADPCMAIPDKGPLPAYLTKGSNFSGPVVYVGDGDSLCVALGSGPEHWIEVRISDFYAPELREQGGGDAKRALEKIALGKKADCVSGKRSYDRIVAHCRISGTSIGDQMRAAGIREGGRGR
ncbi:nuclease [Emcibacter sp. SYSU 3D8]|uniref:thermonuclease family protein n=1 Tax=Emcibacter sp. SYSU 3D8 TaxID=3133969 RepID=UPI0031FF46D7